MTPDQIRADDDDSDRVRSTFDRADNTARLTLELAEAKRELLDLASTEAVLRCEIAAELAEAKREIARWERDFATLKTCSEAEVAALHRDALAEAQAYRAMFARAQEAEAERDQLRVQLQTECHHAAMSWTGQHLGWRCKDWRCDNCGKVGTEAELNHETQVAELTEQWGTDDQADDHEWADEQVDEPSARRIAEADPDLIVVHRFVTKWVQP